MNIERRSYQTTFELTEDGNSLTGYAALYNNFSRDIPDGKGGTFREIIRPHAFDRCLAAGPDVRALIDHDSAKILGRTKSGTLKVTSDARGLRYEVPKLPNTSYAADLKECMTRGDIDQCSFSFVVAPGGDLWRREGDMMVREVHQVTELYDVSPVVFPAYEDTACALRSLDQWEKQETAKQDLPDEKLLRMRQRQSEKETSAF